MNLTDREDIPIWDVLPRSIEAHWRKSDQDIFIAAVILNPFFCLTPFADIHILTRINIFKLLKQMKNK